MAYRNGTYIAFHAEGSVDPTASDIKYYRMILAWNENDNIEFKCINSHEKTSAVRDSSSRETLKRSLRERINKSRNMILIVGDRTRFDADWVPFEIEYAVDSCKLPIIAAYPNYDWIFAPRDLRLLWPVPLQRRIDNSTARVIHVPFKRGLIQDAIRQFDHNNLPQSPLTYYLPSVYEKHGLRHD